MAPGSAWAEVLTLATKEGNESTDVTLAEEDREQVKAHKTTLTEEDPEEDPDEDPEEDPEEEADNKRMQDLQKAFPEMPLTLLRAMAMIMEIRALEEETLEEDHAKENAHLVLERKPEKEDPMEDFMEDPEKEDPEKEDPEEDTYSRSGQQVVEEDHCTGENWRRQPGAENQRESHLVLERKPEEEAESKEETKVET